MLKNMKKTSIIYVCQSCSFQAFKWLGKCPQCQNWNSFEEEFKNKSGVQTKEKLCIRESPTPVCDVKDTKFDRLRTNIYEFDRVLGGGIVSNSVVLISGEPGVGKSTLLAYAIREYLLINKNEKILYVSGEESIGQVAQRMRRVGTNVKELLIYNEKNWIEIKKQIKKIKPTLIIIDSIQTIFSTDIDSRPGTISQIKEVTDEIIGYIKNSNSSCLVVGHITKDGGIAGPKSLEHMVDTVIYFETSTETDLRVLRAVKNRFGSTTEIGLFVMDQDGLKQMKSEEDLLRNSHNLKDCGRSFSVYLEGSRVLLSETQALVVENKYGQGKRIIQGLDQSRLQMLVAIMEKHVKIKLQDYDIFANLIGVETKSIKNMDLAIIASLITSFEKINLKRDIVFLGEVGLNGEVRPVARGEQIINELIKLKKSFIVACSETITKMRSGSKSVLIGIDHVNQIKKLLREQNENLSFD
jgi:DNA repair protein RadA/Sms